MGCNVTLNRGRCGAIVALRASGYPWYQACGRRKGQLSVI